VTENLQSPFRQSGISVFIVWNVWNAEYLKLTCINASRELYI